MNKKNVLLVIVAIVIIGGVYYFTSISNGTGKAVNNLSSEPAVVLAQKDLAAKLGIDEKSVTVTQVTETTWNDGCLGLGGPAESCLQALVPGYKVEMTAGGKNYTYRTDKTGNAIRQVQS